MGPLDTRVLMVDQCARTTSSSSIDRVSAKGSRSGGLIGSSSVTSGWWWGGVSSMFDLFGDGGSVTLVHEVLACLGRWSRLLKFRPYFLHVQTVTFVLLLQLLLLPYVAAHLHAYFAFFAWTLGGTAAAGGATEYVC